MSDGIFSSFRILFSSLHILHLFIFTCIHLHIFYIFSSFAIVTYCASYHILHHFIIFFVIFTYLTSSDSPHLFIYFHPVHIVDLSYLFRASHFSHLDIFCMLSYFFILRNCHIVTSFSSLHILTLHIFNIVASSFIQPFHIFNIFSSCFIFHF